jgi:hypothetical protein
MTAAAFTAGRKLVKALNTRFSRGIHIDAIDDATSSVFQVRDIVIAVRVPGGPNVARKQPALPKARGAVSSSSSG